MPFAVGDAVAILSVRDTGVVTAAPVPPPPIYDVQRDKANIIQLFPEVDLLSLPNGTRKSHYVRIVCGNGTEFLSKVNFSNINGRRRANEVSYRIKFGQNMGRTPRV